MSDSISLGYGCQSAGTPYQKGFSAAQSALQQVGDTPPAFALVISGREEKPADTLHGVRTALGQCPLLGTVARDLPIDIVSFTGPAAAAPPGVRPDPEAVRVLLLASPFLKCKIGVGRVPGGDWDRGIAEAFRNSYIRGTSTDEADSPDQKNLFDWYLYRRPSLALVMMISRPQESRARERMVTSYLYRKFHSRVPLLVCSLSPAGGMPLILADSLMVREGLVMVIFKTDLQFGIERFHNFEPVGSKLFATRTSGTTVLEFNHRPALDAMISATGETPLAGDDGLGQWRSRHPLSYRGRDGRYHLILPEQIGPDSSLTLPHLEDIEHPMYAMTPTGLSGPRIRYAAAGENGPVEEPDPAFSVVVYDGELSDVPTGSASPPGGEPGPPVVEITSRGRIRAYLANGEMESEVSHIRLLFNRDLDPVAMMAAENGRLLGEVFRLRDLNQKVFDGIGYGIALLDGEGRILHANQTYRALVGTEGGERCPWVGGSGSPCGACVVRKSLESQSFASEELEIPSSAGGEVRWLRIDVFPVPGEGGTADSAIEVIRDFSHLKKLQLSLLREKSKLEAIVNGIAESIYIVDRDLNLQFIHPGNKPLPPGADTALSEDKCHHALFNRASPCPWCKVGEVFSRGDVIRRLVRFGDGGPDERYYQITFSPMTHENQAEVTSAACLLVDITLERQMEEEMIKSEKLNSLAVLSAGMAHELNNPLGAINFNIEVLKSREKDGRTGEIYEAIRNDVMRISKIVNNLLTFSRRGSQAYSPISLADVVNSSLDLSRILMEKSGVRAVTDIQPDLPAVFGNFQDLQQVFINLISNAVGAMPSGGEISVTMVPLSDEARLSSLPPSLVRPSDNGPREGVGVVFSDSGIGIQRDNQKLIFDPFFTTKPENQGTGMGLSVVHKILEHHGASIKVHSVPGQGTTFYIAFPQQPMRSRDREPNLLKEKGSL